MEDVLTRGRNKNSREKGTDELEDEEREAKATKGDIDIPTAEVDIKLAEKLDSILNISELNTKFLTNKPMVERTASSTSNHKSSERHESANQSPSASILANTKLKRRNLTKEQIRERLRNRYETLVPEVDSNRASVKVVKILSAGQAIEMGKSEARKQLARQLELNSVAGNRQVREHGTSSFVFKDGYEMPMEGDRGSKIVSIKTPIAGAGIGAKLLAEKERQVEKMAKLVASRAKSVKFSEPLDSNVEAKGINNDIIYEQEEDQEENDDDAEADYNSDDLSESDSTDSTVTND